MDEPELKDVDRHVEGPSINDATLEYGLTWILGIQCLERFFVVTTFHWSACTWRSIYGFHDYQLRCLFLETSMVNPGTIEISWKDSSTYHRETTWIVGPSHYREIPSWNCYPSHNRDTPWMIYLSQHREGHREWMITTTLKRHHDPWVVYTVNGRPQQP